jgi:hypothetical protein
MKLEAFLSTTLAGGTSVLLGGKNFYSFDRMICGHKNLG